MSTERQQKYIHDLGGDALHAAKLTFDEASAMIDRLKRERRQNRTAVTDPRLDLLKGMIDMVPEGYYATRPDENNHVDFLAIRKVTKPTKKFPVGTAKFQSQHSERWEEELVLWPSGQWSVYNHRYISVIMEVVADYKTCAQRYSIELQRCMRCNTELTDDRSRHYLVGPECETKHGFTWPIAYADEMNGGLSFEQLVARGMETRVWQQRALPASR